MPILHNSIIAATTADDPVTRSLRWDDGNNSNLYKATGSTDTTWTVAMWVKRSKLSSLQYFFSWGGDGINFDSSDRISIWNGSAYRYTTALFRDTSNWYHITISCNAGTITIYVNGVAHALSSSVSYPAWGSVYFGRWSGNTSYNFDGYLADIYGIEGSALDHTSFTESNDYGGLKPIAYTGSFGANGFHIDAQVANDSDLLVSSIDRNDGDTLFADAAAGHTISRYGNTHHDNTVGNPFGSGTAMYFDGTGDYLQTSTSSDLTFGTGDFTLETWLYPTTVNTSAAYKGIISDELYSSTGGWAVSQRDDELSLWIKNTGGSWVSFVADGALTANQWQHIAVSYDSSTTTTRLFVDGTSVASGTTSGWNLTGDQIEIGRSVSGQEVAGYLFDVRATKGTARYTSNFSAPSAPFELNPVYIGGDQSGNKNHFTPTNISSHDVMLDVPTKNYATLNPVSDVVASGSNTFSEGNLTLSQSHAYNKAASTIAVSSGKWYAEVRYDSNGNQMAGIGRVDCLENTSNYIGQSSSAFGYVIYRPSGDMYHNGSTTDIFSNLSSGDILQIALDLDSNTVWWGLNGTWVGTVGSSGGTSITAAEYYFVQAYRNPCTWNFGQDNTFAGQFTGTPDNAEFAYEVPTGFKSLNTSNLADPTVTPSEHFNTVIWQGDGNTNHDITGVGFEPSLTWIKSRSSRWHQWYDAARGAGKVVHSNSANSEGDNTDYFGPFQSDGFRLAPTTSGTGENASGENYVAWNWKAHQSDARTQYTVRVEDASGDAWDSNGSFYDYSTYLPNVYMELFENRSGTLVSLGKVAVRSLDSDGNGMSDMSQQDYTLKCTDLDAIAVKWYYDTSGDGQSSDFPCTYNDLLNEQKITIQGGSWTTNNHSNDDGCTDYNYSPPTGWANGDSLKTATTSYTGSDTATLTSGAGPVEKYNAAAGFSIITYSGNGSSDGETQEITHSLGAEPELIITKARTDSNSADGGWNVYHKDTVLGTDYGNSTHPLLWLNQAYESYDPNYSPAIPKSGSENTTITVNSDSSNGHAANDSGATYVMYAWTPVEGYSKFGSFVGNASSDGPMVYTGFRPRYLLIKNTTGTSQYGWFMLDSAREPANDMSDFLYANTSDDEDTAASNKVDFLSNGFKVRGDGSVTNQNNGTMVYIAFAESPFKYANAK